MELKDLTFLDILQLNIFEEELKKQIAMEVGLYNEVSTKGKLKRIAMDSLRERDVFNAKDLTIAYYHIAHKEAKGYSAKERKYINDICTLAYARTIKRLEKESAWNEKHPILSWFRERYIYFKSWFRKEQVL